MVWVRVQFGKKHAVSFSNTIKIAQVSISLLRIYLPAISQTTDSLQLGTSANVFFTPKWL
jgi:hypothetical protein